MLVTIFSGRSIIEIVIITEGETRTVNCTNQFYDGRHREWTRKDGTPVFNNRRILTEDAQLRIIDATFSDAGVYICANAPQIRQRITVRIRGRSMRNNSWGPFLETPDKFPGPKTIFGAQYFPVAIQFHRF